MNLSSKGEIEAKLDRSLAHQVRVPKLDRRFDAGVWARIEAEAGAQQVAAARTARPAARASRWLFASNIVGYFVAALLVAYFGVRMLGNVDIEIPLPSLASESNALISPGRLGIHHRRTRIRTDAHAARSTAAFRVLLSPS